MIEMIVLNMLTLLKKLITSVSATFHRPSQNNTSNPLPSLHSLNDDQARGTNESDEVPICPYCMKNQEAWPARSKKKCSHCKKTMYVRYKTIERERGTGNLILSDKILATEEDAWVHDWMIDLFELGYSKKKFDKRKIDYTKKLGVMLSNRDAVWSILNELQDSYAKKSDLSKVQTVQFFMAKFLKEEKKDPFILLREQGKMRLLQLQRDNCRQVKICISRRKDDPVPCDICLTLENKIYSIDHALDELPLPPKECKNKYCYTYYGQIFESDSIASA